MKTLQQLKTQMLANPETRKEYDTLSEEFGMAHELIAARARMGTTQSAVARLESGKRPPSLRSVQRYAQAIGCRAVVRLEHA